MNTETSDDHTKKGMCIAAYYSRPAQVTWKFADGTETAAEYDLATDAGRHLFAQAAEKLGFGHRRDIFRLVSASIDDIAAPPAAHGPRAILSKSLPPVD